MDGRGVAEGGDQPWGGLQATPSQSEACLPEAPSLGQQRCGGCGGCEGALGMPSCCPASGQPRGLCAHAGKGLGASGLLLQSLPGPGTLEGIGPGLRKQAPCLTPTKPSHPKPLIWGGVGVPLKAQSETWEVDWGPPEGCAGR